MNFPWLEGLPTGSAWLGMAWHNLAKQCLPQHHISLSHRAKFLNALIFSVIDSDITHYIGTLFYTKNMLIYMCMYKEKQEGGGQDYLCSPLWPGTSTMVHKMWMKSAMQCRCSHCHLALFCNIILMPYNSVFLFLLSSTPGPWKAHVDVQCEIPFFCPN